ncbi:hypothetical protein EDD17DRAFT_1870272 [Pisolithus thermaeus]|nr:hypothetical protein EDD17DRAFT_1870272 [Pisolithus thermaeus]
MQQVTSVLFGPGASGCTLQVRCHAHGCVSADIPCSCWCVPAITFSRQDDYAPASGLLCVNLQPSRPPDLRTSRSPGPTTHVPHVDIPTGSHKNGWWMPSIILYPPTRCPPTKVRHLPRTLWMLASAPISLLWMLSSTIYNFFGTVWRHTTAIQHFWPMMGRLPATVGYPLQVMIHPSMPA